MTASGGGEKVVIVTGGSAGIGRATALRFARAQYRVAVWDLHPADSESDSVAREIVFRRTDVTNAKDVDAGVRDVLDRWGRIDVLINNAGITRDAQLVKWSAGQVAATMSDEAFDAVISVNLKGVFHCARAIVPHMIQAGGGAILNASSIVGVYGNFGQTNYAAAKAGVIAFTRTWSRELGKHNIRVNAVAPGFIATEMIRTVPEKVLQNMAGRTPLGRMGKPEDVAEAYLWLASDAAAFITGVVLPVDGGLVLGT